MPRRHRPPPPTSPLSLSPLRILTQILTLQLLYYLCVTSLLLFTALTAGRPFSPDLVLSWRSLRGDTAGGWTLGVCWVAGGVCGYVWFRFVRAVLFPSAFCLLPFFGGAGGGGGIFSCLYASWIPPPFHHHTHTHIPLRTHLPNHPSPKPS